MNNIFNLLDVVKQLEYTDQYSIDRGFMEIRNHYVDFDNGISTINENNSITTTSTVKVFDIKVKYDELTYIGDFRNIEKVSINILHHINKSVSQTINCEFFDTPFTGDLILKTHKLLNMLKRVNNNHVMIVPSVDVFNVLSGNIKGRIYINDTGFYTDKIFVFNLYNESDIQHLGLITSKQIPNIRALKIMKVCNKFSEKEFRYFNYTIVPMTHDCKRNFGVINLY